MKKQNATALTAIISSVFFVETEKDGNLFCAGLAPQLVAEDDGARSEAWAELATSNPGFLASLSGTLAEHFVVEGKPSMSEIIGWHQPPGFFEAADETRLKLWATGLFKAISAEFELPEDFAITEGATDEDVQVIAQCYFEHLLQSAKTTAPDAVEVVGDEPATEEVQAISESAVEEAVAKVADAAVTADTAVAIDIVESAQAIIEGANLPAAIEEQATGLVTSGQFGVFVSFMQKQAATNAKQLGLLSQLLNGMSEQQEQLAQMLASIQAPVTAE